MRIRFGWNRAGKTQLKIARSSSHAEGMNRSRQRSLFRPLTLGQVTLVLLLIFIIPGLVMAAFYRQDDKTSEQDLLNEQARELDLYIANSVQSPFYLSRIDPCSPDTTSLLTFKNSVSFSIIRGDSNSECSWVYDVGRLESDLGYAVVIDEWVFKRETWFISKRDYKWDGQIVVTDRFDPIDSNCFKRREYKENKDKGICLSQSGIQGVLRSPIPPSFYWFFYR